MISFSRLSKILITLRHLTPITDLLFRMYWMDRQVRWSMVHIWVHVQAIFTWKWKSTHSLIPIARAQLRSFVTSVNFALIYMFNLVPPLQVFLTSYIPYLFELSHPLLLEGNKLNIFFPTCHLDSYILSYAINILYANFWGTEMA